MTADLTQPAQPLEDFRPFVDAERFEVPQRGRLRIEVVGLLRDMNDRDPHRAIPFR